MSRATAPSVLTSSTGNLTKSSQKIGSNSVAFTAQPQPDASALLLPPLPSSPGLPGKHVTDARPIRGDLVGEESVWLSLFYVFVMFY
jgi:hypothetical protein